MSFCRAGHRFGQVCGLGADLGPHDLLPKLLSQRFSRSHLLGDAPNDLGVIGQRQENRGGKVVRAANDQHGVGPRQCGECRMGICRARLIDDHHADVLARDAGDNLPVALQKQLLLRTLKWAGSRETSIVRLITRSELWGEG